MTSRKLRLALPWFAVLLDGFDAVVLGAIIPSMLADRAFGLDKPTATAIATFSLVGMMIGALGLGWLTDRIGRRRALIASVVLFSAATLACAVAPTPLALLVLRILAGIGLGGCLPTAIAMIGELVPERRSLASTWVMTGYHVGAVLTAVIGLAVLPVWGWRAMFVVGAAPAVLLVPAMLAWLTETAEFRGAERRLGVADMLKPPFRRTSIAVWVTSFMGLLLVYGLNTWLPQIMRESGYELGAALGLLLALNLGAITGLLVAGVVAQRWAPRPAAIVWFAVAALFLAVLVVRLPLVGLYPLVFLTGAFVFSAQVLVYAYVAAHHPAEVRATAIGLSAGIGRLGAISGPLLGGVLLSNGLAYPWSFVLFAVVGVLAALAMLFTARRPLAPAETLSTPVDSGARAN